MANKILDGGIKTGDTVKIQLLKKEIHFVPVREEKETKAKSKKDVKSWLGYWSKKVLNVIIM